MYRRRALAIVVLLISSACGSGSSPPKAAENAASHGGGGGDSPGDKCLAIATAERHKRPDEPTRITVKHILVKYAGAKGAAATVVRTREAACLRALEARDKLQQGTPWADAVAAYSEEAGATTREGKIGYVERADVVPPFADAAFELGRGDVSHVVETPFGFHIILRSE